VGHFCDLTIIAEGWAQAWASEGGEREDLAPLYFEIISKKRLFFQFQGVRTKFHHFWPPPGKNFGKIPYWPPPEKILPTPMGASLNNCKKMGAEPGRRFLKQPAAKLEPVIVAPVLYIAF